MAVAIMGKHAEDSGAQPPNPTPAQGKSLPTAGPVVWEET